MVQYNNNSLFNEIKEYIRMNILLSQNMTINIFNDQYLNIVGINIIY